MLAPYAGDVLVEHDVTFELYRQVWKSTGRGWWDYWRWRRFEKKWIERTARVVVMSEQDRALLARPNAVVIPERRGPRAVHARDRAARPTVAVRRLVPPFPEHRRVSFFRGAGLAHAACERLPDIT